MVVWLIALALAGVAQARVPPEIGVGENNDTLFADPLFAGMGVQRVEHLDALHVEARPRGNRLTIRISAR